MSKIIVKQSPRSSAIVSPKNIIYDPADPPSGIQYASLESLWSGQETSYHTGDEGWRWQNGEFESFIVSNPATIAQLDSNAANPKLTLVDDNIFGNKNRYTAADGTQNYIEFQIARTGQFMGTILDHLYGRAIVCSLRNEFISNTTFAQAVSDAAAINEGGFSNFGVAGITEVYTLYSRETTNLLPPIGYTRSFYSSTPIMSNYPLYIEPNSGRILFAGNVTFDNPRWYLFVKNIQQQLQP